MQDYVRRQIHQAAAALLEALGLKSASQLAAAHQTIEQALSNLFAMRKDLSDRLNDDSLLDILIVNDELDIERLSVIADLYCLDGEILTELNQQTPALMSNLRALRFYLELALIDSETITPEISSKITNLQNALKGYTLPIETQLALDEYTLVHQEKKDAHP